MSRVYTVRKYANIVNPQVNPNNPPKNNWSNISNAVGNTSLFASAQYTKKVTTTGKGKKKKTTTTFNQPYTLTAHDFKFEIPSNARINEIRVRVGMKSGKNPKDSVSPPKYPTLGFYIRDGGKTVRNTKNPTTKGWKDGIYWFTSSYDIPSTVKYVTYTMSGADFRKGGYTVADLNSSYNGVDLVFVGQSPTTTVYLQYVYMEVDYTVPEYETLTNSISSKDRPWLLRAGQRLDLLYYVGQTSDLSDVTQKMELTIPWGTELDADIPRPINTPMNVTSYIDRTDDPRKFIWTLQFNGVGLATLSVPIKDYTIDTQEITLKNITSPRPLQPIPDKSFYYDTYSLDSIDGYEESVITYTAPVRKRHETCFKVDTVAQSNDSDLIHVISNTQNYRFLRVELDEEASSKGVVLIEPPTEQEKNANQGLSINFKVPQNEKFHFTYRVYMKPYVIGENELKIFANDMQRIIANRPYQVLEPYTYHIGQTDNDTETDWHDVLVGERIIFSNHRVATTLETGAFVLPCHVKDVDSLMIQQKPTIHMYKWEELDYIGCVPLEHLHFDPKSTYKDKLLDSHYKNKRYMGKELASDEDITLNVRLHPHQVTTMQGLIDMDKPIPINANHRCFESDALNHRGWAEIYGITTTETNPHWYKCDIDVKYLTHNLNTRFIINKGDKTFSTYTIPLMFYELSGSGSSIAENEEDFFTVDTDGNYSYVKDTSNWEDFLDYQGDPVKWTGGYWDENVPSVYHGTVLTIADDNDNLISYKAVKSPDDNTNEILEYLEGIGETVKEFVVGDYIQTREDYLMDDVLKNRFTLDEGQHISIKSREPLSNQNQISLRWASSKLAENIENAISRITRIIDEDTGNVVFEYEYCDFDFSNFIAYDDLSDEDDSMESLLSCRVIGRKKNNADYEVVIDEMIDLQSDVETREYQYVDGLNQEHTELKYFGSNLIFEINGSQLHLIDEGFNGKEIERTLELEGKQYRWETYWENKNTGGENDDIIAYFDIVVQDSVLNSTFADYYGSMYVSPFPVSDKKILFTRKGEEGIIYYLEDNDEEFTYMIEPYYQYHNGVDLRNSAGSSIFSLDYGYKTVYLENGLVSLGINRLTGRLFLRKFDSAIGEYQTLFSFKFDKYNDININSISDDRIELQASDTTIIMYRGHPYVIFKHELEDILITTKSYKVYGQSVDGQNSEYPVYFDLMNKDNLLMNCVTKKLDDDCVNLTEHEIEDLNVKKLIIERDGDDDLTEGDSITLNALNEFNTPFVGRVCYLVKKDDDEGYDEIGCNSDSTFSHTLSKSGAYTFMAVYTGDDENTYAISNEITVQVGKPIQVIPPDPDPSPEPAPAPITGDYVLSMSCPSTMYYRDGSKVTFTLTRGGEPVQGKTIEMIDFHYTNSGMTDANGQVSFTNHRATSHPQKYKLGAKFWDGDDKPTKSVYKDVTVKKGTPQFTVPEYAKKVNNNVWFKLKDQYGYNLAKRKVNIKVNSKLYNRVTNDNGNEYIMIYDKGKKKYICTFEGDKDYKSCKNTFSETVKK